MSSADEWYALLSTLLTEANSTCRETVVIPTLMAMVVLEARLESVNRELNEACSSTAAGLVMCDSSCAEVCHV